jgi:hypothetical protein
MPAMGPSGLEGGVRFQSTSLPLFQNRSKGAIKAPMGGAALYRRGNRSKSARGLAHSRTLSRLRGASEMTND